MELLRLTNSVEEEEGQGGGKKEENMKGSGVEEGDEAGGTREQ